MNIWTNFGGESDAFRAENAARLGCRANFGISQARLTWALDEIAPLDEPMFRDFEDDKGVDPPTFQDMVHLDLERIWLTALADPDHPDHGKAIAAYERLLHQTRARYQHATYLAGYDIPPFLEHGGDDAAKAAQYLDHWRPILKRFKAAGLNCLMVVMYLSGRDVEHGTDFANRTAGLNLVIQLGDELGLAVIPLISNRATPVHAHELSYTRLTHNVLLRHTAAIVRAGKITGIGVWKSPRRYWDDAFEKNADGSFVQTKPRWTHIRDVLTEDYRGLTQDIRQKSYDGEAELFYGRLAQWLPIEPLIAPPESAIAAQLVIAREALDEIGRLVEAGR